MRSLLFAASASAYDRVIDTDATAVSLIPIVIAGGDSTSIWTTNASSGCDPVLHVWDHTLQEEVAYNEDLFAPHAFVYVENDTPSSRVYWVIVRSQTNGTQGDVNVVRDYATIGTDVLVGGTQVPVNGGSGYVYETVLYHNLRSHVTPTSSSAMTDSLLGRRQTQAR